MLDNVYSFLRQLAKGTKKSTINEERDEGQRPGREKDSVDPSESVKYFDLALCSIVMSPKELSFLYAMKRGGAKQGMEGGYNWSALASFRGQIDRKAVTSMSGRHQMILIN